MKYEKNNMSVNILPITRRLQLTRNKKKSYITCPPRQRTTTTTLGKSMPNCKKIKSSAEVQQMLSLYFKFYFRTILKKTCKHSLLYICNVYTISVATK